MNKGKVIADEVWRMIPDDCKVLMKGLKKTFKESIKADVDNLIDNIEKDILKNINGEVINSAHGNQITRRGGDYRIGLRKSESIVMECFEK